MKAHMTCILAFMLALAGCMNDSGFGVGLAPDIYEVNNDYATAEEYADNNGYETDDDFSSMNGIIPGEPQDHTLHYDIDRDFILLDLNDITPPMTVTIETSSLSTETDTQIFLYDADHAQIQYDDNGGEGNYSKIVWVCEDASDYYIEVDEKNGRIGDYRITVTYTAQSDIDVIDS